MRMDSVLWPALMVTLAGGCEAPLPPGTSRQPLQGRMVMDDQVITTDGPSMSVSRYGPLESSVCTASFRVGATFGGLNFMVSVTGAGTRTASEVPVALGSVDDNASWLLVEGTETLRLEDEILEVALLGAARCSRDDEAECEEIVDARLWIEGPAYTSVGSLDVEPSTSMVDVGREGLPPCLVLL